MFYVRQFLTFIYLNLDSGVAMHKKGLCKNVSSCGTNRKTCYHISGRSVSTRLRNMFIWLRRDIVRPIITREYPCINEYLRFIVLLLLLMDRHKNCLHRTIVSQEIIVTLYT
jgi:hypothetical protein